MVLLPLKCTWNPKVVTGPLKLFPKSFYVGYHYGNVFIIESFIVGVVVLVSSGCLSIVVVVLVVEFVVKTVEGP